MEGKPPEDQERDDTPPGGWLPPVPPGQPHDPGVFAPPPYQQPAQQPPPAAAQPPPGQYQAPPPAPGYQPPPPPGWNQPPWQQQGGLQQPGWQAAPQGPGNGTAITGFVLSVSSIALLFFSAGLSSVISLGLAIAGAIVGRNGRQKVDRGETTQHRGLGQAGFIVGIVGAVLSVLAIVTWTLIFTLVDDFGDDDDLFDEDFQTTRAAGAVLAAALRLTL
ncbi:MAG: hypothetical protein WD844_17835 [Thermoleophilaceae bacterium]